MSSIASSSARRLPARSCLRPAASARALSRSFSFSRTSAWRAVCTASALTFLIPPTVAAPRSSSESSSIAAFRAFTGAVSEARRCRLLACLVLRSVVSCCTKPRSQLTYSSLSSLPRLPFRLPPSTSRLLSSIALRSCSSSSSCSLLRMVALRFPV